MPDPQFVVPEAGDLGTETMRWEREIERLLYSLYSMTPEEIQIVEGATK